jgi:hypothetical protein
MGLRFPVIAALGGTLVALPVSLGVGQPAKQAPSKQAPAARPQPHGDHGTPEGWKLSWPQGDPGRGRTIFAKLKGDRAGCSRRVIRSDQGADSHRDPDTAREARTPHHDRRDPGREPSQLMSYREVTHLSGMAPGVHNAIPDEIDAS